MINVQTTEQLREVLDRIRWAPSCLALGWDWRITSVYSESQHRIGWLLQATFTRPDTETGQIGSGYGRHWFVERGCLPDSALKTAYLAAQQIGAHELMEAFLVDEVRAFDPHAPVDDLVKLNRRRNRRKGGDDAVPSR